jgi:UDP-galactopyranose mutase
LKNVIWGGRLADYAYYDMDKTIGKALDVSKIQFLANKHINSKKNEK